MRIEQLRNTLPWIRSPYDFLRKAAHQEGRYTFWRDLPALGRTLMTGEPDLIEPIINHPLLDAGAGIVGLRRILGSGSLIMMDGAEHKARKAIVAPSFRGASLDRCTPMFEEVARQHIRALPDRLSAHDLVQAISLRAIARAMFGDDESLVDEACLRIERFLHTFHSPVLLFARPLQIDLGPMSPWGRALRRRDALAALCRERMEGQGGLIAELRARSPETDPEDIVTEVLALLLFGHDTGGAAMAWALVHLYAHGHAERAAEEPEWLEAALKESMRLCPVVPHLTRVARERVEIAGYEIPEGTRIAPTPWLAHHNPALWEDPERFDPSRFQRQIPSMGWFPFGFGARICVGMPFIMRQMLCVLRVLLREAPMRLAPGYVPSPVRRLVLVVPSGGVPVERRAPSTRSMSATS